MKRAKQSEFEKWRDGYCRKRFMTSLAYFNLHSHVYAAFQAGLRAGRKPKRP